MRVYDLYCGLGGWAEGFLSEGFDVIGFDTERHDYGKGGYPGKLVLQDVRTVHGGQLVDAAAIVASPPCQEFSYRAMPWKEARAQTPKDLGLKAPGWWALPEAKMSPGDLDEWKAWQAMWPTPPPILGIELFWACFRIQQEAIEATRRRCQVCRGLAVSRGGCRCETCDGRGWEERYIPLIVENVKGAQPWVGSAAWHFGSYYLWGDVPALMPMTNRKGSKIPGQDWSQFTKTGEVSPHWNVSKISQEPDVKKHGSGRVWFDDGFANFPSSSQRRKAASAEIAKIPMPLARHIAQCFR